MDISKMTRRELEEALLAENKKVKLLKLKFEASEKQYKEIYSAYREVAGKALDLREHIQSAWRRAL